MSNHSARAVYRDAEAQKRLNAVVFAKEQKQDNYNDEMKAIAEQTQRTANKTFWVAVGSLILGLIALVFK